jgi:hypothetical protein
MGFELVEMVQREHEINEHYALRAQRNAERKREIRRNVACTVLMLVAFVAVVCASNLELLQAHAKDGYITTFESRYAVTEDSGLTIVVCGGYADGHVWDVDQSKAKHFDDNTSVEAIFDTKGTADVSDDEIVKIVRLN